MVDTASHGLWMRPAPDETENAVQSDARTARSVDHSAAATRALVVRLERAARAAALGLCRYCAVDVPRLGRVASVVRAESGDDQLDDGVAAAPVHQPQPKHSAVISSAATRVLRSGRAAIVDVADADGLIDVAADDDELRFLLAAERCGVAVLPVIHENEVVAAVTLASPVPWSRERVALAAPVTEAIRAAIEAARLEVSEADAQTQADWAAYRLAGIEALNERLSALAEGSARLGDSLDPDTTIANVVRMGVGSFSDWCVLDAVDDKGRCVRLAVVHKDEAKAAAAAALALRPGEPFSSRLMGVLHTREPRLAITVDKQTLESAISDPDARALVQQLGATSAIQVPLLARGRGVGVLSFVRGPDTPPYARTDLWFAREVGQRAALALDNARLYAQACDAVRLREEFLSIASHELRTPLTALTFQAQALARTSFEAAPEKLRERVDKVIRHADRMASLVDELLDVARISGGRVGLEREDVDLARLVQDVVARMTDDPAHATAQITVHTHGAAWGHWDRSRLEQVVVNLLANALKYGRGKPIEVAVAARETAVVLRVRDHGIGIAVEDQPRIFGRFERAVSAKHFGGFGLGLWIVHQIVEAHGGTIQVESRPGEGASFRIELPREPAEKTVE